MACFDGAVSRKIIFGVVRQTVIDSLAVTSRMLRCFALVWVRLLTVVGPALVVGVSV